MNYYTNVIHQDKQQSSVSLFDFLVILYLLHKLLPSVGHYMPGIIFLGVFGLLFISSFNRIGNMRKLNKLGNLSLVFIISLLVCVKYVSTGDIMAAPIYLYGEVQILLFGFAILTYDTATREHKQKKLFYFILLCYVFTAITTIIGNIKYPMASRLLATTDSFGGALYTSQNIGNFTFTYELVLITPLIIYIFKKNIINRFAAVALVALFGFTIIKTEYTTALLFFALSLILFFIPNLTNKKIFTILIIFVVVSVSNSTYIADLLSQLGQSIESEMIATRFEELATILRGDDAVNAGNAGTRTELYKISFNTFVNTNFAGCWSNKDIGGHSFVLDAMGQYGIFGIFAIIIMYRTIYTLFIKPYKSQSFYSYLLYIYLVAIVLAFLNPKTYLFVFIAVFPLFAKAMEEIKD